MKDGFIKVAAGITKVRVADVCENVKEIKSIIEEADKEKINLLCLPELAVTGYTCADLFFSDLLISKSFNALIDITDFTSGKYPIVTLGLPIKYNGKLYNAAAVICNGEVLGIVPKCEIPEYMEFCEKRYFASGNTLPNNSIIKINNKEIPFGKNLIFIHQDLSEYSFGVEICEDLFAATQVCETLALNGAAVILNSAASNETVGKAEFRKKLISATSSRLNCGYVFSSPSIGESTQDTVFSGHCLIYENGDLLNENPPFCNNHLTVSEIDLKAIAHDRQLNSSFKPTDCMRRIPFFQKIINTSLTRKYEKNPFVPNDTKKLEARAKLILNIQASGLARRIEHTFAKKAVIGISGGLDSTLALLVTVRAMRLLNRPATDILAITMPCFGTTKRTRSNSEILCNELGVDFKEINIADSVLQHFRDIGHNQSVLDVTFENSQARERTQVLMDLANKENGLVIGTGDLSELALGWATYNGDHMSMYGVNADLPKTLIRYIVKYEAENSHPELKKVLLDILNTPVSPELLPADNDGKIAQKTEDLVGPYELHDFFLYYMLRFGMSPKKIYRLACYVLTDYKCEDILKYLKLFIKRFFTQQFKRSCLPDGPKVGSVCLSPRGDLQMPSDAIFRLWLDELEEI